MQSHCSIPPPFLLLLLLAAGVRSTFAANKQPRPPRLPAAEQEAVYHVLQSINPAIDWRSLYPDDLCSSGPHGVVCDVFSVDGGNGAAVQHVVELNFGYVSDFSANPPCAAEPVLSPRLSSASFPRLRKLFFYGCFTANRSRAYLPARFWDALSSSMEELVFVENPSLAGRLSSRIGGFTRLRRLILVGTRVSGHIPDDLGNLRGLQQLVLSHNRLRGKIPRTIGRCRDLKILDLSGNRIAGVLPPEIGRLEALVKLDLRGNLIAGAVPGEFSGLQQLEFLDLGHNNLTGGVPSSLAAMANLKEVYLSGNHRLGGQIPDIWENLGGIVGLGMSGLGLVGDIPASMGVFLGKLCYLGLDNNRLEGRVPEQFKRLEGSAKEINLENNRLSGRVPFSARFVAGVGLKLKLAGNPGLCLGGELSAARAGARGHLGYLRHCNETAGVQRPAFVPCTAASCGRRPFFPVCLLHILVVFTFYAF